MNVGELTGANLDYWVAKAEGRKCKIEAAILGPNKGMPVCQVWVERTDMQSYNAEYSPSSNWLYGGPIIERERIELTWFIDTADESTIWRAHANKLSPAGESMAFGATPLVAAMRVFVYSKFGFELQDD